MAALQILWSAYALQFDHGHAYSPDRATADFLRPIVAQGGKVAVTYFPDSTGAASSSSGTLTYRAVGILPYFDHNIFINQPDAFWYWSTRNQTESSFYQLLSTHPAVVVVEMRTPYLDSRINPLDPKFKLLSQNGYSFTHMFCGARPLALRLDERSCHLIFERSAGSQPSPANQAGTGSFSR
jgi:hypothetical protein